MSAAAFDVMADLYAKRREERKAQREPPAVLAGRALGLDGPLTLERLVTDPDLGALTASPPQRALIRAMDGAPVGDILAPDRMLFHFGPIVPGTGLIQTGERLPSGRPRIVYLRTGVRAGKTLVSVLALLFSVLTCDFRRRLTDQEIALGAQPAVDGLVGVRPGELVRAVIVAPKLKLARSPFQHLVGTMQESPHLRKLFIEQPNKESARIRRPDGREVLIELVAADTGGSGLRSNWLAGAMFDEADFHDGEDASVNLKDNIDACRTRMLAGAQILVPSSPWAEGSPFDKMFAEARKEQADELAFHSDSLSMNPTLDRAEIDKERRKNPENAAREYDAIPFGAGAELFYPEDAIRGSFTRTEEHNRDESGNRIEVYAPAPSLAHVAGGDLGFRKNSSALAISRSDGGKARLAFRLELRPARGASLKPSRVIQEFAYWCMHYGAPAILGDLHYADTAHEELAKLQRALKEPDQADAEQREWVARVKSDPYACNARVPGYIEWSTDQKHTADTHTEMKRRMQEGVVELPADDRMKEQARGTKKKAAAGGHVQILLPKQGMAHGDLWGSVVIACTQVTLEVRAPRARTRREPDSRYSDDGSFGDRGFE